MSVLLYIGDALLFLLFIVIYLSANEISAQLRRIARALESDKEQP